MEYLNTYLDVQAASHNFRNGPDQRNRLRLAFIPSFRVHPCTLLQLQLRVENANERPPLLVPGAYPAEILHRLHG